GSSWSYRLSAGGDVTIASGAVVRTGTGDIAVTAGRDFVLADDTAALYTAGRPAADARYGSFKPSFLAFGFFGEYPVGGGDIRIEAGRDVRGALTGQFFDDWFVQTGNWSREGTHAGETPTAWAVALGQVDSRFDGQPLQVPVFRQNAGALGGGDVDIRAGRDVDDLSVMLPTTGKQTGRPARPDSPENTDFVENRVEVSPGGNLRLTAGRDVRGGVYYAGRGMASIQAGGAIAASSSGDGAVLAVGDSRFDLGAGGDIMVGAVLNPTAIAGAGNASHFFTYTDRSALNVKSLGGNVTLQNDIDGLLSHLNGRRDPADLLDFPSATLKAFAVYPGSLEVSALQGSIGIEHSFATFPSSDGRFTLEAGHGVGSGSSGTNIAVLQSDADPSLLPSVAHPARSFLDASQRLNPFGSAALIHATTPVHGTDAAAARIDAGEGGIVARDPILFSLATPVEVRAGGDMRDVSFKIQHAGVRNSSIEVGGDLGFTTPRDAAGNLLNLVRGIELSGPGQLWINAGGSVDLGTSQGLYSLGNTFNPALPEAGADISLLVGMKSPADFEGFAKTYDPYAAVYRGALLGYLRKRDGGAALSDADAPSAYDRLSEPEQREFLLGLFFGELRVAAVRAAASGRNKDYDRGLAAIEALFPGQGNRDAARYGGDLSLYFSKIHTVDGGDINLLVPGGGVNAGLAVSFSGAKPASELGIVAQREGAINAFANGDFQVNQSRVFAMDGDDITIWSASGNIDAGRGAKSAIAAPPPVVSFDGQGNLRVEFPPVVSGSGIRTAATSPGRQPGDVILAAPRGVVDAGEAGIGGNNVTIAATAVIGASNINVGGIASGIPATTVALPAIPAGAESAAASAAQAAQQSSLPAESLEKSAIRQVAAAPMLNRLEVELVGFGDCSVRDVREGKPGCGG
ncbi:MAG: hemagglutinin-related protein, partial [Proteobacteria bacterium]|nr:hemagglutinin-related protein [Pseudomonadota bacterium]